MTKRPTIIDVARVVGVTDGTVSRALSGDPRVKETTRRKVLDAAAKIGYRPHLQARALKRGSSGIVGVFAEGGSWILHDPYFGRLLAGLTLAADAEGKRLLFYLPQIRGGSDTDLYHAEIAFKGVEELGDGRLDGAVVLGGPIGQEEELEILRKSGLPLVLLSRNDVKEGFSQLGSGARERSRLAALALKEEGHKKLGFIGINKENLFNRVSLEGMREAMGSSAAVVEGSVEDPDLYSLAELSTCIDQLLAAKATGWVVGTPEQAMNVLELLRQRGVKAPDQVSLVSFGPLPHASQAFKPSPTLFEAGLEQEGRACYQMLKDVKEGKPPQSRVIQWKLSAKGGTLGRPPQA